MIIAGLTGSTGSGKGYVCNLFCKYGIKSLDTDAVTRIVYEKGQDCFYELVDYFGTAILGKNGQIDRKKLFDEAFASPVKYAKLGQIAFRHILKYCDQWTESRREDGEKIVIIDAPMLFESGYDEKCDVIISVIADAETQIERVMIRDGIGREIALKRLEKQTKNQDYIEKSDIIIYNSKDDGQTLDRQIEKAVMRMKELADKKC